MILRKEYLLAGGVSDSVADQWLVPLESAMDEFKILISTARASMFLAQILHESTALTHLVENLNYSAARLMQVWPKRFPTLEFAQQYEHNPPRIASYVYANRNGNGDEASGDGWKYKGRGPIQTTGRSNYASVQDFLKIDCLDYPQLLEYPENGARSAAFFWAKNGLNGLADLGNFDAITVKINGGMMGSEQRHALWTAISSAMDKAPDQSEIVQPKAS